MNEFEFFKQISRADILLSQSRYSQAEEILEGLMSSGQESPDILKMMTIAKMGLHKYQEVEQLCKIIIEQNPNEAFAFYMLANVESVKRNFVDARNLQVKAIHLEPSNAHFHAFMSNLWLMTKDYDEALASANIGLSSDAENVEALNARSSALIGLGRKDEAFQTIDKSLSTDPNNPDTHNNMGWGLLHKGKQIEALQHFKSALSENPMHESAKIGISEAMKAKFPLYKYFLMFSLWLSKMKGSNQWGFIIGGFIVYRFVIYMGKLNPDLMPFLWPVIVIMLLFFISSWIFSPLMNLYLLTNPYGRFTLSDDQKVSAKWVGIALAISLISGVSYLIFNQEGFVSICISSFLMMIPLGSMFNPFHEKSRKKLVYFSVALGILTIFNGMYSLLMGEFFNLFLIAFMIGLVVYQWFANYVILKEE